MIIVMIIVMILSYKKGLISLMKSRVRLVAILLVLLLSGCGSMNGQVSDQSQTNIPIHFNVMLEDFTGTPVSGMYADEVIDRLEAYTNCDVEFTWVPAGKYYKDKVKIVLSQKESMPEIMQVSMTSDVISAAKAGTFWNLAEFLEDEETLPNLSQAKKDINKYFIVDGQLIGIYRARQLGRHGWGYRQDWADALGLEEPKTINDFYEMLYQFTYGDPDGNGKDDTYGLCLCMYDGVFDVMQTWFGCGNGWVEEDGELIPVHQTAEYKEALDWFRKIYEEGLVYPDFAVRDTAAWKEGMYQGECGVYVDMIGDARGIWDYFVNNEVSSVTGDGYASIRLMIGLAKDADSEIRSLASVGHSGCFVITKAVETKENVLQCLQFLDKLNDNEMRMLINYGLEGINWEEQDGYLVDLDVEDQNLGRSYSGLNQLVNIVGDYEDYDLPIQYNERKAQEIQLDKEAEQYIVYNPADGYLVNSESYATKGDTLDKILSKARIQYIVGEIDEEGLDRLWQRWLNEGGRAVSKEVNEQFHADQGD